MAVTPLPFLDRTAATFKTDTDTFFGSQLPTFSVQVNQVAGAADASAAAALASKNAAAASESAALTSKNAAGVSATNAATSASGAATSATNAASSATAAAGSATAANTSKNAAATSATNAATSATQAAAAAASIADGPVTSVNGKTGVVALVKTDLGLSLVDNVSVMAAGIGKAPLISDNPNMDSVLLTNGWYSWGPSSLGTKPPGQTRGSVLISGRAFQTDSRCTQLYFSEEETRAFIRRSFAGTWSGWVEITLPALTGNARKPLTPGDAATAAEWSDTLSISKYIDKLLFYGASAASFALDISRATVFDITLSVNTTFTLSNMPSLSGESLTLVIRVRQAAVPKTITWFAGITWLTYGGVVPPTPGANQIIEYVLSTTGTGATWVGRVGAST
jgi:hypothetical protein